MASVTCDEIENLKNFVVNLRDTEKDKPSVVDKKVFDYLKAKKKQKKIVYSMSSRDHHVIYVVRCAKLKHKTFIAIATDLWVYFLQVVLF